MNTVTETQDGSAAVVADEGSRAGARRPRPVPARARMRPRQYSRRDVAILGSAAVSALAAAWLVFDKLTLASGTVGFVLCWYVLFCALTFCLYDQLEERQVATDRLLAIAAATAAALLVVPLALMIGYVFTQGWHYLSLHFFYEDQRGVGTLSPPGAGGVSQAIVGTLEQVGMAVAMGVPAAIVTAIFLNEVGGRFTQSIRVVITAMSGLPSVVAGVFVYSVWVVSLHEGYSGFAGALALGIMLLPSVTRSTEEVLKVVAGELREASLALGAPQWRTVWSVVLPTARSGIVTAVLLGVARIVGETAPLLFTIFGNNVLNANPVSGDQQSLSLLAFQDVKAPRRNLIDLGFASAMVLVIIVLVLFVAARIVGSPKGVRGVGRAVARTTSSITARLRARA